MCFRITPETLSFMDMDYIFLLYLFHSFQLCFIFHSVCKKQTLHFLLHISRIRDFFVNSVSYFHAFVLYFLIFKFDISICVSYFYGPTRTFDKVISNLTFHNRGARLQLTSRSSNRFYWIQIQFNCCQNVNANYQLWAENSHNCKSTFVNCISPSLPIVFLKVYHPYFSQLTNCSIPKRLAFIFLSIFQSLSIAWIKVFQLKSNWTFCQLWTLSSTEFTITSLMPRRFETAF